MPIANNLISLKEQENNKDEYKYDMKIGVCLNCSSLQIVNVPKKELMFNNKYAYFASQSQHMKIHLENLLKI